MMNDTVLLECSGQVAHVIMNRPQVLNALDRDMAVALDAVLTEVAQRDDVRCVLIRGAGDGFMAGGDVAYFNAALPQLRAGDTHELEPIFEHVHGIARTLLSMPKPVLAQVHGAVAGFGVSLMTACDLVMAAANARFTLAYCHLGTSPDGGVTHALPRIVGVRRAMQLALLGERFDAATALDLHLVNWVVEEAELAERGMELARRLAAGPTQAYALTKHLINTSFDNDLEEQLARERQSFLRCATSAEFAEGVAAFVAKRVARFDRC